MNRVPRRLFSVLAVLAAGLWLGATLGLAVPAAAAERPARAAERIVTPNGMVVLIQPQQSLPLLHVQVMVRAGSLYDPPGKAGLANLVAELLDEGTTSRSATQIAEQIDFVGGRLSASAEEDAVTASVQVLKKDASLAFDLLADILLHPAFAADELDRKRREVLGAITAEKDDPEAVARKAFQALIFGQHPYATPVHGTEETLPAITRQDLAAFHAHYYRPNNTIVAIVGDLTVAEALSQVKRVFGRWENQPVAPPSPPDPPRLGQRTVRLINRDLTQANVVLGHLGIPRQHADYYAVSVMNYILGGGGFSSRILKTIREDRGLVYSAHSFFTAQAAGGSFSVMFQTKNEQANQAIRAVLAEIERIRAASVSDAELEEAKAYLIGSFPLKMDTAAKLARLLATTEFYSLGLDYPSRYPTLIAGITKADVLRVARQYLDAKRYAVVVVAKQEKARVDLK